MIQLLSGDWINPHYVVSISMYPGCAASMFVRVVMAKGDDMRIEFDSEPTQRVNSCNALIYHDRLANQISDFLKKPAVA